jgi:hypothetical protein
VFGRKASYKFYGAVIKGKSCVFSLVASQQINTETCGYAFYFWIFEKKWLGADDLPDFNLARALVFA